MEPFIHGRCPEPLRAISGACRSRDQPARPIADFYRRRASARVPNNGPLADTAVRITRWHHLTGMKVVAFRERFERREIVQNPEPATLGGHEEIAAMDGEIGDRRDG